MEVEAVVERSALRAAYEAHYRALLRLSVLLADDPSVAEDIVQDVFVRAASRLTEIEQDRWRAYLRAAVVNAWRNERRRARTRNRVLTELNRRAETPIDERDGLWDAVAALPPRQRACVVLRFYEEMTEAEVANALGCRVGTVKSQTSRALEKLRRAVKR